MQWEAFRKNDSRVIVCGEQSVGYITEASVVPSKLPYAFPVMLTCTTNQQEIARAKDAIRMEGKHKLIER